MATTLLAIPSRPRPAAVLLRRRRIHVRPAGALADREATRRVRHEVYCVDKGFLAPDALFDGYDDRATLLNAFDGAEPVGTMRITDSGDGPLELVEMHPELAPLLPRGRFDEVLREFRLRCVDAATPRRRGRAP